MRRTISATALLAALVLGTRGAFAQEGPAAQAAQQTRPQSCVSVADCPHGMMCAGAGNGAIGSCVWAEPPPHPAYDPLPEGYLGSIYGQPIIQGVPPSAAPPSDAGGVWDMKDGTYRPPRGGRWIYRPAGPGGFSGSWTYLP